jgi:hypothetical protein
VTYFCLDPILFPLSILFFPRFYLQKSYCFPSPMLAAAVTNCISLLLSQKVWNDTIRWYYKIQSDCMLGACNRQDSIILLNGSHSLSLLL